MNEEDPAFFAGLKIGIVGMGLMGSSLALALRGKCGRLTGIDPDPRVVQYIQEHGYVDSSSTSPADLPTDTDLIILAAPVGAILRLLDELPVVFQGTAVVIDCGSTKLAITEAMQGLPHRFDPIGGHPMCGKEKLGPEQADGTLFRDNPFALVPLQRTTAHALQTAEALVDLLGAHPLLLDPDTHDRWVAQTSHLPFLAANALARVTPPECSPLARSGWRSTTRVANTPTSMMMDIIATNRINILSAVRELRQQIEKLEAMIEREEDDLLRSELDRGTSQYRSIFEQGN
jgi:prephenate dehydrogenase